MTTKKLSLLDLSSDYRDAKASTSTTDYIIDFSQGGSEIRNASAVTVKSVSFPNIFPNITSGRDDVLTFDFDNSNSDVKGEYNLTIPQGFYNIDDLITTIIPLFNAIDVGGSPMNTFVTMTIEKNEDLTPTPLFNNKLTFTFDNVINTNNNVRIVPADETGSISTASPRVGIAIVKAIAYSSSFTSDYIPQLDGLSQAFVHCTITRGHLYRGARGGLSDVLTPITMDSPYMGRQVYHNKDVETDMILFPDAFRTISRLRVQLRDKNNNILSLQGRNLKIILTVYHKY